MLTFNHDHEICDHIQCPECLNLSMPLRKALIKLLAQTKKECEHNDGWIQKMSSNNTCISKTCLKCGKEF